MMSIGMLLGVLAAQTPAPQTWRLSLELVVGDSAVPLREAFASIAVNADGTVYVPQRTHVLKLHPDGMAAGTLGMSGRRPGGFTRIAALGLKADTLWVSDFNQRKVSLFGPDERLIREIRLPPQPPRNGLVFAFPEGMLSDGTLLGVERALVGALAPGETTNGRIIAVNGQTGATREIGRHMLKPTSLVLRTPQGRESRPQPFADSDIVTMSHDGMHVLVVRRLAATDTIGRVELIRLSPLGDTLDTRSVTYPAARMSADYERKYVSTMIRLISVGRGIPEDSAATLMRSALYRPAFVPLVDAAFAAATGQVWLRLYTADPDVDRWWVVDWQQGVIAELQASSRLRILWATSTHVWGLNLSRSGPQLHRYRILRGRQGRQEMKE